MRLDAGFLLPNVPVLDMRGLNISGSFDCLFRGYSFYPKFFRHFDSIVDASEKSSMLRKIKPRNRIMENPVFSVCVECEGGTPVSL